MRVGAGPFYPGVGSHKCEVTFGPGGEPVRELYLAHIPSKPLG
jgi:hypothetical protein